MKALAWVVTVVTLVFLLAAGLAVAGTWGLMTPSVDIVAEGVHVSIASLNVGWLVAFGLAILSLPLLVVVLTIWWLALRPRDNPRP